MKKMTENIRDGYEEIIQEQLKMGVIEEVPIQPTGKRIFYMPHKSVVREEATSTNVRMVFDATIVAKGPGTLRTFCILQLTSIPLSS